MNINPLTAIDFYKADHRRQYPEGTTLVYSNFTARSNKLSNLPHSNDKITFFGLQYFIKEFLQNTWNKEFFKKPKEQVVARYKRRLDTALGPNAVPVDHIAALHDLGYLPLEIRAIPEGSQVGMKIPCLTIHNTHPDHFWLVNYIESVMSSYLWKPSVSATTAKWYRNIIDSYAEQTGSDKSFSQFQGHDFSFRGMSGPQDAALSAAGHLLAFAGTDTVLGIDFHEDYYNADAEKELIGCSVPATEHSVMCMGTKDDELGTFKRLVTNLYPSGIVSIVSDTWDFWKVISEYVPALKPEILARNGGAIGDKVVIRPDSGDPVDIICGTHAFKSYTHKDESFEDVKKHYENLAEHTLKDYYFEYEGVLYRSFEESYGTHGRDHYTSTKEVSKEETYAIKGAIRCLYDTFGGTVTSKGYKVLDSHIGLIYGDSITPQRCQEILQKLMDKGFASSNVVFGIGSYTYQYCTRDTYGFAVKSTYGEVNGEGRLIFKDPVTDNGTKKSAKGLLKVEKDANGDFVLKDQVSWEETTQGELKTVFKDGVLLIDQSLAEIRERVLS